MLTFGITLVVPVAFKRDHLGIYTDRIEFIFKDVQLRQNFVIVRQVRAVVGSLEYYNLLPKAPYVPKKRTSRDPEVDVVPGDPPPTVNSIKYVVQLPHAHIPERVSHVLKNGGSLANILRQFRSSILPPSNDETTYGRYFKTLIWAEEYRSE